MDLLEILKMKLSHGKRKDKNMEKILLGYELKIGSAVFIKPSHMVVTGLTQLSGKTTTLKSIGLIRIDGDIIRIV